ncbi:MAG: hypothetical protein IPP93_12150 [Chitinophagaceae bacterium]|nr:hypothetical protein [Chitinophagaceae bacterium]
MKQVHPRKNYPIWLLLTIGIMAIVFLLLKSWQRSREIEGALHQNTAIPERKK